MKSNLVKKIIISLVLISLLVIVDQWSKLLAVDRLMNDEGFEVIKSFLTFEYVENPGAAFSSFLNKKIFLCSITVVALILFSVFLVKCNDRYTFVGLLLTIGGAIGNFIDRIRLSYVIDFIHFHFFSPVFNLADVFLVVGIGIIILVMLFEAKNEVKEIKNG